MRFSSSSSSMIPYGVQLTCYSSSQNSGKHICKFQMKRYIEWGQRWSWVLPPWSWCVSPSWCGWTPYYWDIMEASSHKHDQLLTLIPAPLPSLGDKDWGWKSHFWLWFDPSGDQPPSRSHPELVHWNKRCFQCSSHSFRNLQGLPRWCSGKQSAANAGDAGLIPESGRSPGVGNGNPFQYSCLGNPMDRGAWWAMVQWVTIELDMTYWLNNNNSNKGLRSFVPGTRGKDQYIHLYYLTAAAAAKSLQSCLTLCDPIDSSLPGSPVPGILQARTLEWVAISFSNAWKWKVKVKSLSRVQL